MYFTIFLFLPAIHLSAQKRLIKSVELKEIGFATLDRAGDLYIFTASSLIKFDKDGKQLAEMLTPPPTAFDTGNGVRLLMYFRQEQRYKIITPSLSEVSTNALDNAIAIEPWLVCSAGDYNILIFDDADLSVKKVDTQQDKVLSEFKVDSTLITGGERLLYMQAYQNFTFLLDRQSGISIYNSMGRKLKTITITGINSFHFLGQELYYFKDGKLHFTDLFSAETRVEEIRGSYKNVLITDERLIGISPNRVDIFEYTPQ